MLFETLSAPEQTVTIRTRQPRHLGAFGRKPATLARIQAPVLLQMLVSLLTRMAIVITGEKFQHLGDDVIVVIMHVEVNPLVFFRAGVDDFIAIFLAHNTDLVFAQVRLELFGLFDPARTERYVGILVKFPCQARLHRLSVIRYVLVLRVVFELGL